MSKQTLTPNTSQDPDFVHAERALKRAALRARERARRSGVAMVYTKDGVLVWERVPAEAETRATSLGEDAD